MRVASLLLAPVVLVVALCVPGCDGKGASATPPASTGSPMGPLEEATNRQGRDLSQGGARLDTAQQCSDLCAANAECRAMSFAKNGSSPGGICFLKSSVPSAIESPGVTSAVKQAAASAAAP